MQKQKPSRRSRRRRQRDRESNANELETIKPKEGESTLPNKEDTQNTETSIETKSEVCRICHEDLDVKSKNVVKPCYCNSWVHQECLQTWIEHQNGRKSCEVCRYEYQYTAKVGCCLACLRKTKPVLIWLITSRPIFYGVNWIFPFAIVPLLWKFDTIFAFRIIGNHELLPDPTEMVVCSVFAVLMFVIYLVLNLGIFVFLAKQKFPYPGKPGVEFEWFKHSENSSGFYITTLMVLMVESMAHLFGALFLGGGYKFRGTLLLPNFNTRHELVQEPSFITFSYGLILITIFIGACLLAMGILVGLFWGIKKLIQKYCKRPGCLREGDPVISNMV